MIFYYLRKEKSPERRSRALLPMRADGACPPLTLVGGALGGCASETRQAPAAPLRLPCSRELRSCRHPPASRPAGPVPPALPASHLTLPRASPLHAAPAGVSAWHGQVRSSPQPRPDAQRAQRRAGSVGSGPASRPASLRLRDSHSVSLD